MTHPIFKGYEDEEPIKRSKGTRSAADATRTNIVQASMDADVKERKAKTLRSQANAEYDKDMERTYGGSIYDPTPPIHVVTREGQPSAKAAKKAESEAKEAKKKLPPGRR